MCEATAAVNIWLSVNISALDILSPTVKLTSCRYLPKVECLTKSYSLIIDHLFVIDN